MRIYLEYPSSEQRDLAHAAVRLDLIEWGAVVEPGLVGGIFEFEPPLLELSEEVVVFMHSYSSFGKSSLPNCSINSWERNKVKYVNSSNSKQVRYGTFRLQV